MEEIGGGFDFDWLEGLREDGRVGGGGCVRVGWWETEIGRGGRIEGVGVDVDGVSRPIRGGVEIWTSIFGWSILVVVELAGRCFDGVVGASCSGRI